MVKMEVITPIEEPTGWVSSLVIVEKPNGQCTNVECKVFHKIRCQQCILANIS